MLLALPCFPGDWFDVELCLLLRTVEKVHAFRKHVQHLSIKMLKLYRRIIEILHVKSPGHGGAWCAAEERGVGRRLEMGDGCS